MNEIINNLRAENAALRRQLRECRPAWGVLLAVYIIGFMLGALYAIQ